MGKAGGLIDCEPLKAVYSTDPAGNNTADHFTLVSQAADKTEITVQNAPTARGRGSRRGCR